MRFLDTESSAEMSSAEIESAFDPESQNYRDLVLLCKGSDRLVFDLFTRLCLIGVDDACSPLVPLGTLCGVESGI